MKVLKNLKAYKTCGDFSVFASLLFGLLACANYVIGIEEITPSAFEFISETSIDVAKVNHDYENIIHYLNLRGLISYNEGGIGGLTYLVPTNNGYKECYLAQRDGLIYFKINIGRNYSLGFQSVLNGLYLRLDTENEWPYQYGLIPFFIQNDKYDFKLVIGALLKIIPVIIDDPKKEKKVFVLDSRGRPAFKRIPEFCFGLHFRIFEIGSFYDFMRKNLKLFEYKLTFPIGKTGILSPGFNYYRFLGTKQVGLNYVFNPTEVVSFKIENYLNLNKIGLAYFAPTIFLSMFKHKVNEQKGTKMESNTKKKFFIKLSFAGSYSKDIFREGLYGYSVNIAFENIPGSCLTACCCPYLPRNDFLFPPRTIVVSFSRNYHSDLLCQPAKNKLVVRLGLQFKFY